MELLGQELRKIWRPGIVAVLAVLGVLYYLLFPRFYVEHFHNGPNAQSDFDIAVGWMERFGPTMEPEERVQVDAQLADEIAVFDDMVADLPEAAAAGIVDYPSYTAFEEAWVERWQDASHDDRFRADSELHARIVENTNLYRLQELQTMMNGYDTRNENLISQDKSLFSQYSPEEQDRIRELENPAREQGYLSMHLEETTTNFAKYVAVWVALSVILLLSPVLARDRLHRVRALQWSSRQGRRTVDVQCAAGLLSALALTAANLAVYGGLFVAQGPLALADTPLYSFVTSRFVWFDGTYGQYLLVLVALVAALGMACGALALFLSRYSSTYVVMLLKATPLFVGAGALFGSWLLDRTFYFREVFWGAGVLVPRFAEVACVAVLLLAALLLCAWSCRRTRKQELLE